MSARFVQHDRLMGFDPNAGFPGQAWQMVPRGGTRDVHLDGAAGFTVRSMIPQTATIRELTPATAQRRTFRISGLTTGTCHIDAWSASEWKRLYVSVLPKKTIKLTFHYVHDIAGHGTRRSEGEENGLMLQAYRILGAQANVWPEVERVVPRVELQHDLGTVVCDDAGSGDDLILANATLLSYPNCLNVFFVHEFERTAARCTDAHNGIDTTNATTYLRRGVSICLLEDNVTNETLAHEIGHYLGVDHSANTDELMCSGELRDRGAARISMLQARQMNGH